MSVRTLNGLSGTTINVNSFSAGTCLDLTTNTSNPILNFDINKATLTTSNSSTDMFVYKDSSGNTKRINYNDLISSSGLGLTANNALTITNSIINLDINKQSSKTSASTDDEFVLEDNSGNIKKITYSNLISGVDISTATNIGTSATGSITLGNSSQSLALNSSSMNAISDGKHFFRSNLSTGLSYEVQGYNSSSPAYHSVLQIHNVSSGFPYLSFLLGSGFQTSQYANKNLVIDSNGKIEVGNLITLTSGEGITLSGSNAIDVDISKQVAITTPASDDELLIERNTGVINKITYGNLGIGVVAGNAIAVSSGTTVNVEISKPSSITTPASGDLFLLEQAVDGVLKNISFSNLSSSLSLGAGIGISIDSTPDINIDFSQLSTATQMFSQNEFMIFSDSDSLYKHITFQNVLNSIDLSPAFNFGTASSFPVNIGHANNQTLTLQGSLININGSNKIKNRSTVSTGTGFEVDGYNSADSIYYSSLKLDNSNVAGVRPTIEILGASGFYGGVGQNLTIDSNGKIDWITPSTSGAVLEQYNTTTDLLNSVQTSGKMALVKNPLKLWVYANLSSGLVWRSLSFDTATNLSLNQATYDINSTGSAIFNSGATITASSTGDVVKVSVKVNDDLDPTISNNLIGSSQTALDGWDGSSVVSMTNAFSLTNNQDGTYTYEGQVKTKNETDTTAITYTITDINSSTILTFNYSIQNSAPTGFGTGSPSLGSYYAIFNVWSGAYFTQASTNYSNLGITGNSQYYYYVNGAGSFNNYPPPDPTNTSNNSPMIFHYTQLNYNGSNIAQMFATSYNGSAGSYTSYSARNFLAGHSTGNMSFVSAGNDEYYMYSSNYQLSSSGVSPYSSMAIASGQNTTYSNQQARFKFYRVA